jgi:hypothetical protein
METPSQDVSSFDHFVTQWMSARIGSLGRALNSSQFQVFGSETAPVIESVHRSNGV